MSRRRQSQWDFGELFAGSELRRVLTVSELNSRVRRLLEGQIGSVWVAGEISNLRQQSSGHGYFTLKDAAAQLSCVLFRGEARASRHLLEDGRSVLLHGDLTVYEPRGQYQLRVTEIELKGVGALQLAFEKLKQKLDAEGVFDPGRKRTLPAYPARLGVVTSPTGAALRDVLHVLRRRFPALEIVLAAARVQGGSAAGEVAAGIERLNRWSALQPPGAGLDLILTTRGGGSLEDLWPFNEEIVARAIHASALPVVSAVGHEIDFTISDFVADVRAATPSAAAEIITEHLVVARQFVTEASVRLPVLAGEVIGTRRAELESLKSRLERVHPLRQIQLQSQRLDDLQSSLQRMARSIWRERASEGVALFAAWQRLRPAPRLGRERDRLAHLRQELTSRARDCWRSEQTRIAGLAERLRLLSPTHTLARGYSITQDAQTGRIIRSTKDTRPGQPLETRVADGAFRSVVEHRLPGPGQEDVQEKPLTT
ncbi:MAG: exodeoxyribonuclease VII large subunit [Verrucomicrobiales bacterium]|nr:exodeoxyribonuclease VII large subunit [Verrucomicrobiales bacterium]